MKNFFLKESANKKSANEQSSLQNLESLFGSDLTKLLLVDNSSKMKSTNQTSEDASTISTLVSLPPKNPSPSSIAASPDNELKKRQKLDEYFHIEEKQAKLLKLLYNRVYKRLNEENNLKLDPDEMNKVFYVVVELEQLASMVHEQVASQIKKRVELEWNEKPFCGDILISYYHYYKVYRAILARYPTCQCTLSNLLKKKNFAIQLKKFLVGGFV